MFMLLTQYRRVWLLSACAYKSKLQGSMRLIKLLMCAYTTVAMPNFLLTHTQLVPRKEQKWHA